MSKLVRLAVAAALAGSAALAASPLAGAASSIKCSKLSGNAATKVHLSGCTGNTGGAAKPLKGTALASGGTIKWVNGKKTTITFTVKAKGSDCPEGSSEFQAKGKVTKDNTGSATVGGTAKGKVCVDAAGNVSLAPHTKMTI